MAEAPVNSQPVDGLWSFLTSIDWSEPWLKGLIGFHIICLAITSSLVFLDRQTIQIFTFLLFLGLAYASEYINEWAAENYKMFSRHQYFDSNGMFISILLSTPLLLNCFLLVTTWMYKSVNMMIKLKRAKLIEEQKTSTKKDK